MEKVIGLIVIGGVAYSAYKIGKLVGQLGLSIELIKLLTEELEESRTSRQPRYGSYADYYRKRKE